MGTQSLAVEGNDKQDMKEAQFLLNRLLQSGVEVGHMRLEIDSAESMIANNVFSAGEKEDILEDDGVSRDDIEQLTDTSEKSEGGSAQVETAASATAQSGSVETDVEEEETEDKDYEDMGWNELRSVASERDVYNPSMDKEEIIKALKEDGEGVSEASQEAAQKDTPSEEDVNKPRFQRNSGAYTISKILFNSDSPLRAKEIKEMLPSDASVQENSVSQIVHDIYRRGLADREKAEEDKRAYRYELTDDGRKAVERTQAAT